MVRVLPHVACHTPAALNELTKTKENHETINIKLLSEPSSRITERNQCKRHFSAFISTLDKGDNSLLAASFITHLLSSYFVGSTKDE